MQTMSSLKIWLLSVNFEKFTIVNYQSDRSQFDECEAVICRSGTLYFSMLMDSKQIFRNYFICIHYHLCEISAHIVECKNFAP